MLGYKIPNKRYNYETDISINEKGAKGKNNQSNSLLFIAMFTAENIYCNSSIFGENLDSKKKIHQKKKYVIIFLKKNWQNWILANFETMEEFWYTIKVTLDVSNEAFSPVSFV
ncbi:hypothetical protein MKS88_005207 [Plasmodium brasilianum]|uniref:Uncharacterized protein n=1 Tax=Plasmodium brasilianum TaxID=5824 RepID=A0ACB9Y3J7_PLABR|nr:hypothetical protein MKS88_005207 [Plasmodium brasilianum]